MSDIRVYRFGLLPPHDQADLVRKTMRLAHKYRNTLVEIERGRRAAVREVTSRYGNIAQLEADARAADAEVGRLVQEMKAAKSVRKSHVVPIDAKAALVRARDSKREATRVFREARKSLRDDLVLQMELDQIFERAAELRRNARAHCGIYWGTYLLIEAADAAAQKMPLYDGVEPSDPHFSRWSGEGRVGVQIQKGADVSVLDEAADRRIRIEPGTAPKGVDPKSKRSAKRRHMVLAMRVDSDGAKPIFARWRMVVHRPIPAGARIKNAAVSLRLIGPREEWSVALTIDTTACAPLRAVPESGSVGVDLGWRVLDGRVRSAAWDAGGERGFLELPQSLLDQVTKAASLRSIRDDNFNKAVAAYLAAPPPNQPAWFKKATATIGQWCSSARLTELALRWRKERFAGDAAVYEAIEAWRYHDHHLWQWESSQRTKALRHRREIYRIFAAGLARKYKTLALEAEVKATTPVADQKFFDLRKFAKKADTENEKSVDAVTRAARVTVSPSELRLCLINAFGPSRIIKVDQNNTTRECGNCGEINTWDAAADLWHRCTACNVAWDQDANAAMIIRSRSLAPTIVGDPDDSGIISETRWTKARRMSGERKARRNADAAE